jgi:hypothetical protein
MKQISLTWYFQAIVLYQFRCVMWGERLKRIIILAIVAGIVYIGAQFFQAWSGRNSVDQQVLGAFDQTSQGIAENGVKLIRYIVSQIPIAPELKDGILSHLDQNSDQPVQLNADEIKKQGENAVEGAKQLPQAGVKEIEKAVFKDFCNQVMN